MEGQRQEELKSLQEEKEQLKKLVEKQSGVIEELKQQLQRTSEENSVLQQQQHELAEMVNNLMQSMKSPNCESAPQHLSCTIRHEHREENNKSHAISVVTHTDAQNAFFFSPPSR